MRAIRSIAIAVLLAFVTSLWTSSGALAHAGLVTADPAEASVLATSPAQVTLTFNEPVSPLAVTLVTSAGERQDIELAAADGARLTISLPAALGKGTHLVSWRVASADGHPVAGTYTFSVGAPGAVPGLATGPDTSLATAIWLVRAALYAVLFIGVGMAVFDATVARLPAGLRRIPMLFASAGLLLAPIALDLQGLDALGLGLGSLASARPFFAGLSTSYGATVLTICGAMLALLLSLALGRSRLRLGLVLIAWAAAALAPVLSGHAGTAPPEWLSKPAVVIHIAGIVFWVGALAPLGALLRSRDPATAPALQRFSMAIPLAVAALLVGGLVLALLQMGPPGLAWQTPYAYLLAAKLALLVPLFGLALFNRLRLTRPALAGDAAAMRHLRASILVELLVVLVVFGVVAGWRFTPPPRVVAELASRPAHVHLHGDTAMADVTLTPGRAGNSEISVFVTDAALGVLVPKAVKLVLSNAALGIDRLQLGLAPAPDGFWRAPVTLPAGGRWTIEIDLRVDDFTMTRLSGDLDLAP